MKTSTEVLLKENLKLLKLSNVLRQLETFVRQAKESGTDYGEFLLSLTEMELQMRAENRLKRRVREAKFPLIKTLETFDYTAAPGLDLRLLRELETGDYIREHRNIILLGNSGTGKTHLATGLGVAACGQGSTTRFVTGCGLANELIEAQTAKTLSRVIQRTARNDLLVLDELGYVPFSKEGAQLLFQVLAERNERRSVIITTNLGFADWTQVFGDATLTAALLDRLTHKAHIIHCNWDSYRLKETLKTKKRSADKQIVAGQA
ncbi:MAG: IS21-like element helper ATPase IstB [Syntrophobacteraceae bacterium]